MAINGSTLSVSLVLPPLPLIMAAALLPTADESLDGLSNMLARSSIATAESLENLKELARWVLETLSPSVNQYNKHAWELLVVSAARATVAKSSGCAIPTLRDITLPTIVVTQCKGHGYSIPSR